MSLNEAAATRSRGEIADAIQSLSPAEWVRLKKVARRYAIPQMQSEDLLQEAFTRALDGGRKCPANVGVVKFLAETMRSVAHGERELRRPVLVPIEADTVRTEAKAYPDPSPTAENRLIDEEQAKEILGLFADDETAAEIVEGVMAGLTASEIRELTGLDKKAYDTKRKLIRRRINAKYPDGWTP